MMRVLRPLCLIVLALFAGTDSEPDAHASFRVAENSSKAIAGQAIPIVHTGYAFGPTAHKLPRIKTARAIG
jgi:hypothetical protein